MTKALLIWKDEGDAGPATLYSAEARKREEAVRESGTFGRPYGAPRPEGEEDLGWMTRAEAEARAGEAGAEFREV